MDTGGEFVGPRSIGIVDVLVYTNPRHGPADTVTSTTVLEHIVRDALGLHASLGFYLNVMRPTPGTCVLGSNVDFSDRPDLYIKFDTPTGMTAYNETELWESLSSAVQRWIPTGAHTIIARINNGRGVFFNRDSNHPREASS